MPQRCRVYPTLCTDLRFGITDCTVPGTRYPHPVLYCLFVVVLCGLFLISVPVSAFVSFSEIAC